MDADFLDYAWIGDAELETKCIRDASKRIRRGLTDQIQAFVDLAKENGSSNADWYYTSLSRTANEAMKQSRPTLKLDRDAMPADDLRLLAFIELSMTHAIRKGVALCRRFDGDYHPVFEHAKSVAYAAADADPALIPKSRHTAKRRAKAQTKESRPVKAAS